jgi:hypothetical protein
MVQSLRHSDSEPHHQAATRLHAAAHHHHQAAYHHGRGEHEEAVKSRVRLSQTADARLARKDPSMQQLSGHRVRPRIGKAQGAIVAALLFATALSQPNLAYAGPHGGAHGGGSSGFHGRFAGLHNSFGDRHEGFGDRREGQWFHGWRDGRFGWWWERD